MHQGISCKGWHLSANNVGAALSTGLSERRPSTATSTAMSKTGLVLSGGGARGAYQAGVLRGIFEVAAGLGIQRPFQILTGVSAGAVNTAFLAAHADNPTKAVKRLTDFWGSLHSADVLKTDACTLAQIGWQWARDAVSGGTRRGPRAQALLDTSPLADLIRLHIPFDAIRRNLDANHLEAVAVSATDYTSMECLSFYMARRQVLPWHRSRRIGVDQNIGVSEVLASAAIPILFPPVRIGKRFFGDGCLRNSAPLSPAVHLGADRLIVIGVRKAVGIDEIPNLDSVPHLEDSVQPSIARVLNVIINAVLLDAVDADIERLARINNTVDLLGRDAKSATTLRYIDWLYFHPSADIAQIAIEEARSMPNLIRYLMAGIGTTADAADLVSYLLFEPAFSQRLLKLGYLDALARANEIANFLSSEDQHWSAEAKIPQTSEPWGFSESAK